MKKLDLGFHLTWLKTNVELGQAEFEEMYGSSYSSLW